MVHKLISTVAFISVVTCTALVVTGIHDIRFEKPYLSYPLLPFPVVAKYAKAGDIVPVIVERCNSDSKPHNYITTHGIKNVETNAHFILPEALVSIAPGCTRSESRINYVPAGTPAGKYMFLGMVEIPGNYRMHHVDWTTETFEVVK